LARQDKERRAIETAMSGLGDMQRPRVIYFNRAAQTLRVSGKNTNNDYYIHLAGGRNVAADSPPQSTVTIEQVLTWNPQVVLLGNFDAAMPSEIYADPRWQGVDAVRNRRVYKVPLGGYRWDPPSQESALMWIWLAGLLQPDREPAKLRAVMRDWFGFLYQHDLSDDEIDGILFAAQNGQSAGYDRYLAR
jgi:iron complex transport system substrate-binding protein